MPIDLAFTNTDLDLMYKLLPFLIYNEESEYIQTLKNKFVIEEMYNSHKKEFIDQSLYPLHEMATLSKLFCVLENFPNEKIYDHCIEHFNKLTFKTFRIPSLIKLKGDEDTILYPPPNQSRSDESEISLEDILTTMKIDTDTLNNMLNYIMDIYIIYIYISSKGFPGGTKGKESSCQCRRHKRHRFDPWVGKIP